MVGGDLQQEFTDLIYDIFQRHGLRIDRPDDPQGMQLDFVLNSRSGVQAAGEIKLYRTENAPVAGVLRACEVLHSVSLKMGLLAGVLVVGNTLTSETVRRAKSRFPSIVLYGLAQLNFLVREHADLAGRLEDILRKVYAFSDVSTRGAKSIEVEKDLTEFKGLGSILRGAVMPIESAGNDIIKKLDAIPSGRDDAMEFQRVGLEAVKHIFKQDLTAWDDQFGTEERVSIFDGIARINSEHDFWKLIVSKFETRYVIFEFKNYTDQIGQTQIYTTEKYLFRPALRSTAIVISRVGANKNALKACRSAFREHGKLILNLTLEDLRTMLKLRDEGGDHNGPLVTFLDNFLMKLEP